MSHTESHSQNDTTMEQLPSPTYYELLISPKWDYGMSNINDFSPGGTNYEASLSFSSSSNARSMCHTENDFQNARVWNNFHLQLTMKYSCHHHGMMGCPLLTISLWARHS